MNLIRALFLLLIVSWISGKSNAQVLSNNGTFSIEYQKGCVPFTVDITQILPLPPGISRQYTYEDETTPTLSTTHTYNAPGVYDIAQILGQDANKFDTLKVEVFEATRPEFQINQCSGNGLAITPSGGGYDSYRVYFTATDSVDTAPGVTTTPFIYGTPGTQSVRVLGLFDDAEPNCGENTRNVNTVEQLGAATITNLNIVSLDPSDGALEIEFSLLPDVFYDLEMAVGTGTDYEFLQTVGNNIGSLTVNGLNTESSTYCFRLSVTDACNGETFISNTACSVNLSVEAMNGFNDIMIDRPADYTGPINLIKDGALFTTLTDPAQTSFQDSLVTCGRENCYALNLVDGGFSFASRQVCATGISAVEPPPVNDITVSVEGDDIRLTWRISNEGLADTVAVRRSRGSQALDVIARTTEDEFLDTSPGVNQSSFTYDITYADACGNQSETSTPAQTMFLDFENTTGNVYILEWNPYSGWFAGVGNYFLQRLDPSGNVTGEEKILSGFSTQVVLTNLDSEPVSFRIRAESLDPTPLESYSNIRTFEFVPELFIPGAFTPNGDNLNDILEVEGTFVTSLKFKIFNRWGEVIFYSEDRNQGWDGTIRNKNAASGTYVYSLEFTDEVGRKFTKKGTFVLMR